LEKLTGSILTELVWAWIDGWKNKIKTKSIAI